MISSPISIDGRKVHLLIGTGGQAKVYLCDGGQGQGFTSVKVYDHGQEFQRAYQKQLEILNKLNHKNIIRILDFNPKSTILFIENGREYKTTQSTLTIQFSYYSDLLSILTPTRPISSPTLKYLLKSSLLPALIHIEEIGISHRDIKAQNILLMDNFQIKIIDFGLAVSLEQEIQGNFNDNYGTQYCKAPQIYTGSYKCQKIDVFALGVLIFSMATGKLPFRNAKYSNKQYGYIRDEIPQKFWSVHMKSNKRSNCPLLFNPEFQQMVTKMISFSPSDRPTYKQLLQNQWLNTEVATKNQAQRQLEQLFLLSLKGNIERTGMYQAIDKLISEKNKGKQQCDGKFGKNLCKINQENIKQQEVIEQQEQSANLITFNNQKNKLIELQIEKNQKS